MRACCRLIVRRSKRKIRTTDAVTTRWSDARRARRDAERPPPEGDAAGPPPPPPQQQAPPEPPTPPHATLFGDAPAACSAYAVRETLRDGDCGFAALALAQAGAGAPPPSSDAVTRMRGRIADAVAASPQLSAAFVSDGEEGRGCLGAFLARVRLPGRDGGEWMNGRLLATASAALRRPVVAVEPRPAVRTPSGAPAHRSCKSACRAAFTDASRRGTPSRIHENSPPRCHSPLRRRTTTRPP